MGNIAGIGLVVFSGIMSSGDEEAGMFDRPWTFYVGVAAPCILGLITANILTSMMNLPLPERV